MDWNQTAQTSEKSLFKTGGVLTLLILSMVAVPGMVVAHEDDDRLTTHDQTKTLDEHGEVHTLTIAKATADTAFYIDIHRNGETINTTRTFKDGTTVKDLTVTLSPTIKEDTNVTVAVHTKNGSEITAETMHIDVVDAPTVAFNDQTRAYDKHNEVHTIIIERVAADQPYYVDVHTANGTINTTRVFDAGTVQDDLTLTASPSIKHATNVTVAVHAKNGTELAAEAATVTTADVDFDGVAVESNAEGQITAIRVERATAEVPFYVDVHTANNEINTTREYDANTTLQNITLQLSTPVEPGTDVNVAVHAATGTEIAAQSASMIVTGASGDATSQLVRGSTTTDEPTSTPANTTPVDTSASTLPGFGAIVAVIAIVASAFALGRRE